MAITTKLPPGTRGTRHTIIRVRRPLNRQRPTPLPLLIHHLPRPPRATARAQQPEERRRPRKDHHHPGGGDKLRADGDLDAEVVKERKGLLVGICETSSHAGGGEE